MTTVLIYCDDPSHTSTPVGPFITGPNPAPPGDVFIADELRRVTMLADDDYAWLGTSFAYNGDQRRQVTEDTRRRVTEDTRQRLNEGTLALPRFDLAAGSRLAPRGTWEKRCRWCGQRAGRWKTGDLNALMDRLVERGITGISLRTLDLMKHSH